MFARPAARRRCFVRPIASRSPFAVESASRTAGPPARPPAAGEFDVEADFDSFADGVARAEAGEPAAIEAVWRRFFERVVAAADARIGARLRRCFDGEDIALSVFASLAETRNQNLIPPAAHLDNLWPLLVIRICRKVADRARKEKRKKRGGGAVVGESWFANQAAEGSQAPGLEAFADDRRPGAASAADADCADLLAERLERLEDDDQRRIVALTMAGHTLAEIAAEMGLSVSTVSRRRRRIYTILRDAAEQEP